MASSSNESNLSMSTLLHLVTHRLNSTNYLLWRNQIRPVLAYQNLLNHVEFLPEITHPEITVNDKKSPNPDYVTWVQNDQRAVIIIQASLSEEASAEVVGLSTAKQIWDSLESAYSGASIERVQNLRDKLRLLTKGSSSVTEFGRSFKNVCDQLAAIGHPIEDTDKTHWFLCGLGPSFENFSTAVRTARNNSPFRDLIAQAESHELFLQSLHGPNTPAVAFSAAIRPASSNRGRGQRSGGNNGSFGGRTSWSFGRGRGRRPPHCQLCRTNGHFANNCPQLPTFASNVCGDDKGLTSSFNAQCNITPDWYMDSGATDHMSTSSAAVSHPTSYTGSSKVSFGNGNTLPISHIGYSSITNDVRLNDVLVVPKLTKNLLSISKLTRDNDVDVLFSHPLFYVQDRSTKRILAQGR